MQSRNGLSRLAVIGLVAGALATSIPTQTRAGEDQLAPTQAVVRVIKAPQSKPMKFDWLADRGRSLRPTLVSDEKPARQIGTGSWICSPAGFGKKSRCYSN